MAEQPWVPFYFADYLADTGQLSLAEHGAYLLLLAEAYRNGGKLPCVRNANASSEHRVMHRLCRCDNDDERAAVDSVLWKYFERDETGFVHVRVMKELAKRTERSELARESANRRWGSDAKPMRNVCEPPCETDANAYAKPMREGMRNACVDPCETDASHNHSYSQKKYNPDCSVEVGGPGEGDASPSQAKAPPTQKPKAERRKPSKPIPEDWTPNASHAVKARALGVNLAEEAERFANNAEAKDVRWVDWDKAFMNWLLKAKEFKRTSMRPNETPGRERTAGSTGGFARIAVNDAKLGVGSPQAAVRNGWCRVHPGRAAVSSAGLCAQCRDAAVRSEATA